MQHSPLGKSTIYDSEYNPGLLFPIPRKLKREEINVPTPLPFNGVDIWNAYEISWLDPRGKPIVAIGQFSVPCTSVNIFESKSFKLYLNSFNQTHFDTTDQVLQIIRKDLSKAVEADVEVKIFVSNTFPAVPIKEFDGYCLDDLPIETKQYSVDPLLLQCSNEIVEEKLFTHLLKSNCLVTNQPDWGTLWLHYKGPKIDHSSLLKYVVSFRNHNEFHEQCIERVFIDISQQCRPELLTVYGKYTRRGGIDINPYRSTHNNCPEFSRTSRQ